MSIASGLPSEDVFLQIDVGLGDAKWCALAPGFAIDLPTGVVLVSAAPTKKRRFFRWLQPDDEVALFELHLMGGQNDFIRFIPRLVPAATVKIKPGPEQQLVGHDQISVHESDGALRQMAWTELEYQQRGERWRQLSIVAPVGPTASVIVSAQAHHAQADALFRAAKQVATTLGPFG